MPDETGEVRALSTERMQLVDHQMRSVSAVVASPRLPSRRAEQAVEHLVVREQDVGGFCLRTLRSVMQT